MVKITALTKGINALGPEMSGLFSSQARLVADSALVYRALTSETRGEYVSAVLSFSALKNLRED